MSRMLVAVVVLNVMLCTRGMAGWITDGVPEDTWYPAGAERDPVWSAASNAVEAGVAAAMSAYPSNNPSGFQTGSDVTNALAPYNTAAVDLALDNMQMMSNAMAVAKEYESSTGLVVNAMGQYEVLVTLTNDMVVCSITNAVANGRSLRFRFAASGGDRAVTWDPALFIIPESSSMQSTVTVSNDMINIYAAEYEAVWDRWLIEANVTRYRKP